MIPGRSGWHAAFKFKFQNVHLSNGFASAAAHDPCVICWRTAPLDKSSAFRLQELEMSFLAGCKKSVLTGHKKFPSFQEAYRQVGALPEKLVMSKTVTWNMT